MIKSWKSLFVMGAVLAGCGGAEDIEGSGQIAWLQQGELAVSGEHRLMAGSGNVDILNNSCGWDLGTDESRLYWNNCATDGNNLNVHQGSKQAAGSYTQTDYPGADTCVAFVKAMTGCGLSASGSWIKGANLMSVSNVPQGTIVATQGVFDGTGTGHTGIFVRYEPDDTNPTGFRIWDQNWGTNIVKRHKLYKGGSGNADADHYYIVRIRDVDGCN